MKSDLKIYKLPHTMQLFQTEQNIWSKKSKMREKDEGMRIFLFNFWRLRRPRFNSCKDNKKCMMSYIW